MKTRTAITLLLATAIAGAASADTAARYVQNGLVACWDGYENAGAGQHNPSTTTWVDIVGGRTFSLTGVTVGADRMVFAGNADSYGILTEADTTATFGAATGGGLYSVTNVIGLAFLGVATVLTIISGAECIIKNSAVLK